MDIIHGFYYTNIVWESLLICYSKLMVKQILNNLISPSILYLLKFNKKFKFETQNCIVPNF